MKKVLDAKELQAEKHQSGVVVNMEKAKAINGNYFFRGGYVNLYAGPLSIFPNLGDLPSPFDKYGPGSIGFTRKFQNTFNILYI